MVPIVYVYIIVSLVPRPEPVVQTTTMEYMSYGSPPPVKSNDTYPPR